MSTENTFDQFAHTHQQSPQEMAEKANKELTKGIIKAAGKGLAWYIGLSVTVGLGHLAVRKARSAMGLNKTITVTVQAED